jgi:hypothetical protein
LCNAVQFCRMGRKKENLGNFGQPGQSSGWGTALAVGASRPPVGGLWPSAVQKPAVALLALAGADNRRLPDCCPGGNDRAAFPRRLCHAGPQTRPKPIHASHVLAAKPGRVARRCSSRRTACPERRAGDGEPGAARVAAESAGSAASWALLAPCLTFRPAETLAADVVAQPGAEVGRRADRRDSRK